MALRYGIPYGPVLLETDAKTAPRSTTAVAGVTTVMGVTVIATESLSKRFPRVTALDRLSVDVGPGVTGLVGANGAGKSTLIKILLGLSPATEGRAEVLGLDVATKGADIRERVGYMPEHDCLPPDVSATEFVVHMARMSGLPPTAARERTADTLRHVGLYEERYRPIGGYSTGMKQRVKLAQALVHNPQLVFLDETDQRPRPGRPRRDARPDPPHPHRLRHLRPGHLAPAGRAGAHLRPRRRGGRRQAAALQLHHGLHPDHHDPRDRGHRHRRRPDGTRAVRDALDARGVTVQDGSGLPGAGHVLLLTSAGEETYDLVRDVIADLGLGLVRMEQRRHHISEVFTDSDAARKEAVGHGS
ncbi:ABC transporter ATP-binding protein [Streptomyces violaceorubidus]